jgi:hypothetical protein
MARLMLSDEQWAKLKEIMLQHQIYNKPNLRMIVEAMHLCLQWHAPTFGSPCNQKNLSDIIVLRLIL